MTLVMDRVFFFIEGYMQEKKLYGNFAPVPFMSAPAALLNLTFLPQASDWWRYPQIWKTGDMAKKRICAGYMSILRRGETS